MKLVNKKKVYPERSRRVFVGMSGGVDSSVAALLLKNEGYDVVGVFMRCWSGAAHPSTKLGASCAWDRDALDARRVAEHLEIPFYVWDFEHEYKERVVKYMIEGYRAGITPNPDVMCNKEIKFGLFFEKARAFGADFVATGHYVRIGTGKMGQEERNTKSMSHVALPISLFEAKDKAKDQSYFLWTLTQKQLKYCLSPIGDYLKSEVREIARGAGLPTAEKKDSQGICFLGQVRLGDFLRQYIQPKTGQVRLALNNRVIGEHDGAHFYTIGQRHGIGIGGGTPYYVAEKNVDENYLVVAESDNPALYRKEIELTDMHFIDSSRQGLIRANKRMSVLARVRYRQPLSRATLEGNKLIFEKPQKFVAAGQSAVFYSNECEMLGGGIIVEE